MLMIITWNFVFSLPCKNETADSKKTDWTKALVSKKTVGLRGQASEKLSYLSTWNW